MDNQTSMKPTKMQIKDIIRPATQKELQKRTETMHYYDGNTKTWKKETFPHPLSEYNKVWVINIAYENQYGKKTITTHYLAAFRPNQVRMFRETTKI